MTAWCCLSVSRYRLLESRLEETVQQTMKIKEEKISSLEKKVEEGNKVSATLLAELSTVRTHTPPRASPAWSIITKYCYKSGLITIVTDK